MSAPPDNLGLLAADRVQKLMASRLASGGIATSRPEWYSQAEPGVAEPYPGGWQIRVRTWRHWSDARVHLDADSGELMYQCVDRLAEPPAETKLDKSEALRIAAQLIAIPRDARLRSFRQEQFTRRLKLARLEWDHYYRNFRVDGDYLWVLIHPETHRLVALGRKWRTLD